MKIAAFCRVSVVSGLGVQRMVTPNNPATAKLRTGEGSASAKNFSIGRPDT